MAGGTLVGFRVVTTISLLGIAFYPNWSRNGFGMPNARMSSLQLFQRWPRQSGLTILLLAYQMP
jgi:hypothetical protein